MSHPSGFWDTHIEGDKRAMLTTGQNTSSSPSHPELLWKLEIPVDPAALTLPPSFFLLPEKGYFEKFKGTKTN